MVHARRYSVARLALLAVWAAVASGDEASAALLADGACAEPGCGAGADALGLLQTRDASRVVGGAGGSGAGQVPAGEGGALALSGRGNSTEGGSCTMGRTYDVCFFANVWFVGDVMCATSCGFTHMALETFCQTEHGHIEKNIDCGSGYDCEMTYDTLMSMKGYDPQNLPTDKAMGATGLAVNGVKFYAKSNPGCLTTTISGWLR